MSNTNSIFPKTIFQSITPVMWVTSLSLAALTFVFGDSAHANPTFFGQNHSAIAFVPSFTVVQSISGASCQKNTGAATSVTCTFGAGTKAGNQILFSCVSASPLVSTTPASTQLLSAPSLIWDYNYIGLASTVTAGTTTVTLNPNATSTLVNCIIAEVSGLAPTSPVDASSAWGSGASGTTVSTGSVTNTLADDIIIGFLDSGTISSCTAGSGYTRLAETSNDSTCLEYKKVSAIGANNPSFTYAPTGTTQVATVAFKLATVPAIVQTTTCTSTGAGNTFTCSITPTANHVVLMHIASQTPVTAVSDNHAQTWVKDVSESTNRSYIYRVANPAASATTVTVTNAYGTASVRFYEVSGIAGTLDQTSTNSNNTTGSTTITTGSTSALAQSSEFALAGCYTYGSTTLSSGPTNSFTGQSKVTSGGGAITQEEAASIVTSSTNSLSTGWTISSGNFFGCTLATYK